MVQSPPPRNSSHTERHILALLLRAPRAAILLTSQVVIEM
jgi:hypothetical protein